MAILGAHVSAAQKLELAVERARTLGAECFQIFTRAPGRWGGKDLTRSECQAFREARTLAGSPPAFAHDLYLTNLAAENDEVRERSIASLARELARVYQLGLDGLICHMGSHPQEATGLDRLALGIELALDSSADTPATLLLETTAGQGNCLGHRFEHLGHCLRRRPETDRLGVCLDTCHVYAAGYDLSTPEGYAATLTEFDRQIGLPYLKVLHLNDSQKPLGSRVDRHAHIGEGYLGPGAFERLVNDPRLRGLPMLIETPEMETHHRLNLDRLKQMRQQEPPERERKRPGGGGTYKEAG